MRAILTYHSIDESGSPISMSEEVFRSQIAWLAKGHVKVVSLETLNDIGASEYLGVRTLTVSVFTTWLNRGSLAGAAQLSCFMLAIVAGLLDRDAAAIRGTAYLA